MEIILTGAGEHIPEMSLSASEQKHFSRVCCHLTKASHLHPLSLYNPLKLSPVLGISFLNLLTLCKMKVKLQQYRREGGAV